MTNAPILTAQHVNTLNAARTLLRQLSEDARDRYHDARSAEYPDPDVADYAYFRAHTDAAEDAVFQVLNVANAYRVAPLTENQIHNREES